MSYGTSFTIFDKEEYNKMKTTAYSLNLCMRKYLWKAAVEYTKTKSDKNTLLRFFDIEKPQPIDIFKIWDWDKYIRNKDDLEKVRELHRQMDYLIQQKERDFN